MALNESLTLAEKSRLAVWDYPVSDKFTKAIQIQNIIEKFFLNLFKYSFGSISDRQEWKIV